MKIGYIFAAIITVFLSVVSFVEQWIWSPLWSLLFFTVILSVDFLLSVIVDFKKEGLNTAKGIKFLMSVVVAWVVLGVAHNLSKLNIEFGTKAINSSIFDGFSTVIYMAWLLFNLASIIRHASILGYMPKPIATFFLKYINTKIEAVKLSEPTKNKPKNDKT